MSGFPLKKFKFGGACLQADSFPLRLQAGSSIPIQSGCFEVPDPIANEGFYK
jgi:hypothetical protein